jgi:heme-degrading monooxygenase HmoA
MYLVIFKAELNQIDEKYKQMDSRLRELAISQFGCVKFESTQEDQSEISLSYWNSLEDIKKWKTNIEHLRAQSIGKSRWYKDYSIEICKLLSEYSKEK